MVSNQGKIEEYYITVTNKGIRCIKVLTPDSCGGCFIFNYNSSLRQEHIHNLSCKAGKTLDQINYLKYISSYRKKKTKETRAPNITSLLTILRARKRHREPLLKCHIYS